MPSPIDLSNIAAGTGGFVIYGQDAWDFSGWSVASAGDINGDGFDDLIIGAIHGSAGGNAKTYAGEGYVVFGKAAGLDASIDLTNVAAGTGGFVIFGQDANDQAGSSVASAGDINGDGFDDVIITARLGDAANNLKTDAGDSYVVFGMAAGFGAPIDLTHVAAGTGGFVIHGQDAFDKSGFSVATAGDINGDGFDDLILGAVDADAAGNLRFSAGDSYVVFGKSTGFGASVDLATVAAGSGGFVVSGQDAHDGSGRSVASAGDINGDGFDDLIIGAPHGDAAGNLKDGAGDSYVVFGKAAGFDASVDLTALANGTGGFVIHGQDAGDYSGFSVASAGDVNGDGFGDLIVGAIWGSGPGNARSDAGDSYVVYGKPAGFGASVDLATIAAGTGGFVIFGQDELDRSGLSVASAGDINSDGYDDLIIATSYGAAEGNAKTNAGESYVVFGKATSFGASIDLADVANGTGGFVLFGQDAADRSGHSVASAGDVDGDGFDDLIIGAFGGDAANNAKFYAGESYVIFGDDFTGTVTHAGTASADSLTGTASADAMIGGQDNDTLTGGGGADVLRGGAGNDVLCVADLAFLDVDGGNGTDTLALTASGLTLDLTQIANPRLTGIEAIDLTGNGNNALVITALEVLNLSDSSNALRVDGDVGDRITFADAGWARGATAAGYTTFSHGQASVQVRAGVAVDGLGAAIDLSTIYAGTDGFVMSSPDRGDRAGFSVASAGDFNGDGFADLIVGAYGGDAANNAKPSAGDSYVVFGTGAGFNEPISLFYPSLGSDTAGFVIHGQDGADNSGRSVASAGDINGDGFDDLIIGAAGGDGPNNTRPGAGDSYVVFGRAAAFGAPIDLAGVAAGSGGFVIFGQDAGDSAGWSVASAGDINGDGFDDLIIGAKYGDASANAKSNAGESYVVLGKATGFGASIDLASIAAGVGGFIIFGRDAGDQAGWSVASAGDIDADGFDDLIIGAHLSAAASNAKPAAGESYVVFGKAGGFGASIDLNDVAAGTGGFAVLGEDSRDMSGWSVASAGDVDGDGFGDVIIGAWFAGPPGGTRPYAGLSYVVFGKATGFDASVNLADIAAGSGGFVVVGQDSLDSSGHSVASAGDLNGDGFGDFLIGTYASDGAGNAKPNAGDTYVVFGKAAGFGASIDLGTIAAGTGGFVIFGRYNGDRSGISVAAAGDIDGDGFDDLITGAWKANGEAGLAYVIFGRDFTGAVTHAGTASADILIGTANADAMIGDQGDDTIVGGAGADAIKGGAGNDLLAGGAGADRIDGGNGVDSASYAASAAAVAVSLATGRGSGGDASGDLLADIEQLFGSNHDDVLSGDGGANRLDGGAGNDTLSGGQGHDLLNGNTGDDVLSGGNGNDTLVGGRDNDSLDGGDGDDRLSGNLGTDFLTGGAGSDTADYANATDAVVVDLNNPAAQLVSATQGSDLLSGIENLVGGLYSDTLLGNPGFNVLTGNGGADTLFGWEGSDILDGGEGDDSLNGGIGGDVLLGGNGNDNINGGKGFDNLDGGEGNDTLNGALGADLLTGGNGADRFVFSTALDGVVNVDTIADFTGGVDRIALSAAIFGAFAGQVGQTVGLSDHLTYNATTGVLAYDADGTGNGAAVNFAILGAGVHPGSIGSDFLILA